MSAPPYNAEAEECLIGYILLSPERLADVAAEVEPSDFYLPQWRAVWSAFLRLYGHEGVRPDVVSLSDAARPYGYMGDSSDLIAAMTNCPSATPSKRHVEIVKRCRLARDLLAKCSEMVDRVSADEDPYEILESMVSFSTQIGSTGGEQEALTMEEIVAMSKTHPGGWVVPGLIRRDQRVMVVAGEGTGKGVLLRSCTMSAAQGFHPLHHGRTAPIRTLLVDLENPLLAVAETGGILMDHLERQSGGTYDPTRFRSWRQTMGIDLRRRGDRANLIREIALQKPDLVAMGPLYKMFRRKSNEGYEDVADDVINILDDLRTTHDFALMLEHHAPKGKDGGRDLNPMGSQRFMAWPDIGLTLKLQKDMQTLDVGRYRGDRMKTAWPDEIYRDPLWLIGGTWDRGMSAYPELRESVS